MENKRTFKLAIVAPTCFYYQTPLFRALAMNERLDLTVYFCSDEGLSGKDVKSSYGSDEKWGGEGGLLDGYGSKFLKNYSPWGSYLKSLVGLANFGIWRELSREQPDAVIVMSWMNPTWWLVFLACVRFKIPVLFMTDANVSAERLKSKWKSWVKKILLGKFLFRLTSGFLYAGKANRQLYSYYGVPENKLVPFAYSWGYGAMVEQSEHLIGQKNELRKKYGLPHDSFIILYCGRLSPEKGSQVLMEAYKMIDRPNKALVLVGDGRQKGHLKRLVEGNGLDEVYFMGFKDRNEIGNFYSLADLLVLPSHRETWGIVVNEALCFSLPVIVSDQVGAGNEMVMHQENGLIFPAGDSRMLAGQIKAIMDLPEEARQKMRDRSGEIIRQWAERDLGSPLIKYLDSICSPLVN